MRNSTSTKPAFRASSPRAARSNPRWWMPSASASWNVPSSVSRSAMAIRPPGRSRRRMAASAVAVSSTWCSTRSEIARSNGSPGWRLGLQVEGDGRDLSARPAAASFSAMTSRMPLGRLGQHQVADVIGQREAEQPGPGADVDRARSVRASARRSPGSPRRRPRPARDRSGVSHSRARSSNVAMAALPSLLTSRGGAHRRVDPALRDPGRRGRARQRVLTPR